MSLLSNSDRAFAETISQLAYCNPFLPRRIELERAALGDEFHDDVQAVWSKNVQWDHERANIEMLIQRLEPLVDRVRNRLEKRVDANPRDLELYADLVMYLIYHRCRVALHEVIEQTHDDRPAPGRIASWGEFLESFRRYFHMPGCQLEGGDTPAHAFACFFQIRRAFHHIFHSVVGESMPAARLRAAIWQSIFTHDMRRYRRGLYQRMDDVTTLIIGPSGTGKELVARAIGLSRYIPFDDERQSFVRDFAQSFHSLNLSAMSPTLIESELFGHCRGAFTGAVNDRAGWLEVCGPHGTVFLDEIGDLDAGIQVKLLRVLQDRRFQRLGETEPRLFQGKVIAATNRDLDEAMQCGRFRDDFYYRLCSDVVRTPSLAEQISDCPADLDNLVLFLARRAAGEEAGPLAEEVKRWIDEQLGPNYRWPGNIRELEQCVRNVMIRNEYRPAARGLKSFGGSPAQSLLDELQTGELTAEELLRHYCTLVYAKSGSYEQAARQLKLDRRTVKSKVDPNLLNQWSQLDS